MQKFGYTEEMLQTRLNGNMKEKQQSHEKLSHTKIETNENNIIKLSTKLTYLEKKILHCGTMLEQFWDTLTNLLNKKDISKKMFNYYLTKAYLIIFPINIKSLTVI